MKKALLIGFIALLVIASSLTSYLVFFSNKPSAVATIEFSSEVPGYTLAPAHQEVLQNYLSKWGTLTEKNEVVPDVESISVVLVPQVQKSSPLVSDGKTVLQSHNQTLKNGQLTIFVYVNPEEVLSRETEDSIASRITLQSLWAIYTSSIPLEDKNRIKSINEFLEYLNKDEVLLTPIVYVEKSS